MTSFRKGLAESGRDDEQIGEPLREATSKLVPPSRWIVANVNVLQNRKVG
jgi:hypothetical protein